MTADVAAAGNAALTEALEYTLGQLDALRGRPSRFTATEMSPQGLAALAGLVLGVWCTQAMLDGVADPMQQLATAEERLEFELKRARRPVLRAV